MPRLSRFGHVNTNPVGSRWLSLEEAEERYVYSYWSLTADLLQEGLAVDRSDSIDCLDPREYPGDP